LKPLISNLCAPALAVALLSVGTAAQAVKVDAELPEYTPTEGVAGTIKSVGSDTMNNLMALWGQGFRAHYPNCQLEVDGKGSSTAPPKLIQGASTFGPMSRPMKGEEKDRFKDAYGYEPTELKAAIDMLAVYVHKDNPIESLTLQQVDAIFSATRRGGHPEEIRTWGQLGLEGEWKDQPISLYGRNSASGTYGFFKDVALFRGDFKASVKENAGSSTVVQGVGKDRFAIGYSGIGYKTADVRAVPIAKDASKEAFPADVSAGGKYPLARFLLLYVNYEPNSELDPLRREFVRYVFSKQGQADVVKSGFYPVPAKIAAAQLAGVGLAKKAVNAGARKR